MSNQHINIILREPENLDKLIATHKFSLFPRNGNIVLELGSMSDPEREKWQSLLQRYYFACGCKEGAAVSVLFFILFWIYSVLLKSLNIILSWEAWLLSVPALIVGAVLGKALGLVYAKCKLKFSVKKLTSLSSFKSGTTK